MKQYHSKFLVAIATVFSLASFQASAADANNGKALVEKNNCGSCHGADLKSPIAPNYPKLAGQHADYIAHALHAYQLTNNPLVGRSNAIMGAQAKVLSATDIKDIAAYIESLPSTLIMKK